MPHALIGVGGNLGTDSTIAARFLMAERALGAEKTRWSPLYVSEPVGPIREQPRFLNAVLALWSSAPVEPVALLSRLLHIEATLGRQRAAECAQGPRTIDLDLLFVGHRYVQHAGPPALCLPHPRIAERAFVLRPLADLMGEDWVVPGVGQTGVGQTGVGQTGVGQTGVGQTVGVCLRAPDVAAQARTLTRVAVSPVEFGRQSRQSGDLIGGEFELGQDLG